MSPDTRGRYELGHQSTFDYMWFNTNERMFKLPTPLMKKSIMKYVNNCNYICDTPRQNRCHSITAAGVETTEASGGLMQNIFLRKFNFSPRILISVVCLNSNYREF